jgi:acetolactate synthase-1/2/3 large subunit
MSEEKGAAFFDMLGKSERPLIYAGGGVIKSDAARDLRGLRPLTTFPVTTTLTRSAHSIRLTRCRCTCWACTARPSPTMRSRTAISDRRRRALRRSRRGQGATFAPNAKNIAHIDIDATEIGKVKQVTWSHVSDARTACRTSELRPQLQERFFALAGAYRAAEGQSSARLRSDCDFIQPNFVLECLNRIVQGEAIICTGVGQHQMWAAQYLDYKHPRSFLTSGSMGTMGFGLPPPSAPSLRGRIVW